MSGGRPFFAFAFHNGLGQSIGDYADADIAAGTAYFVWLHLDLGDQASQVWLSGRPWPADVVQLVAAPIQRGRLFITSELIPVSHSRGPRLPMTAKTVMSFGRRRRTAPSTVAAS